MSARAVMWVVTVAVLCGAGCAGTLRGASSGQIGCPADDIEVTDDHVGFGSRTWVATCNGRRYFCSAVGGQAGTQVSCAEQQRAAAPAPAAAPAAVGCQYDTQCKGERICRDGSCVDP